METKTFGVLEFFDAARGFGFVRVISPGSTTRYFLHVSKIISGEPKLGAAVRFIPAKPTETKKLVKHLMATEAEIGEVLPKFLNSENTNVGGAQ